jgi:hypothetical protein
MIYPKQNGKLFVTILQVLLDINVEMDFISAFDRIVVASDLLKVIEKAKINEK